VQKDKFTRMENSTMKLITAYHEDVIAVWQSDKYGHPQRVKITNRESLTPRQPSPTSWTDRYGHASIAEPANAARCKLLNTGGDSKASCSMVLRFSSGA
jgi:hypothetical protein